MRLFFDINHPAHVHLFRNLIRSIRTNGGDVLVATREKDVTVDLCQQYNIPQKVLSSAYSGSMISGLWELITRTLKLLILCLKYKPEALVGTSMSIGIIGRLISRPSVLFFEDDQEVIPLIANYVYPSATYLATPHCLAHEAHGKKHITYAGYHELAYLHPDHFCPDPRIPRSIGLKVEKPYFILRFVSLKAIHDSDAKGISFETAEKLIRLLSVKGQVLITSEGELHERFRPYQFPLPPSKFLDVLAFSALYIGDSQTVAAEAAVLGVPGIRCNSFVGKISYLNELEHRFELTKGIHPDNQDLLFAQVEEWLKDITQVKKTMQKNRKKLLSQFINVSKWQEQFLQETVLKK